MNIKNYHKAIFLDRDGTLNIDKGYTYKIEDCLIVEEGIGKILEKFRQKGYLLIIITNQAGIDKGYYKENDFNLFMKELEKQLGIKFDKIYFCPYHPDFSGVYNCRKPDNGMILQAQKDLNIDLKKSFMIGDNLKDIEAGKKSKCKTILLKNKNIDLSNLDISPDFIVGNWSEIEEKILMYDYSE